MKKIISFVFLCIIASGMLNAQKNKPFVITGKLGKASIGLSKVMLYYEFDGKQISDSAKIINGGYGFKGVIDAPTAVLLEFATKKQPSMENFQQYAKSNMIEIFIAPGKINIVSGATPNALTVTGSPAQIFFEGYKQEIKATEDQINTLNGQYFTAMTAKDSASMKKTEATYIEVAEQQAEVRLNYVEKNLQSPIAVYVLNRLFGTKQEPKIADLFGKLTAAEKQTSGGKQVAQKLTTIRGMPAPDFTLKDTSDMAVTLSSFRGKYVLLDFWASWCMPCRAENPNIVRAFQKFKGKDFVIVSVSMDRAGDKVKWLSAIRKDGLNIPGWVHISDLQYWSSPIVKLYGIYGIPANFLLNKEGKIIDKDLRGDLLEKKLEEILGQL
jgi:peroxiredoxin